jgi:hypothetical protein
MLLVDCYLLARIICAQHDDMPSCKPISLVEL